MPNAINSDAALQNSLMLARLLGEDAPDQAFSLLNVTVQINYDHDHEQQRLFAQELHAQLKRTITTVRLRKRKIPCIEVSINGGAPLCWVSLTCTRTTISSRPTPSETFVAPDGPTRIIGASYACAFVVARIVNHPERISTPDPLVVERTSLPPLDTVMHVDIGACWLLGAGAVGCAVLWAMRGLPVSGRIHVVDPKRVTPGNLNRQILFEESDVTEWKAEVAVARGNSLLQSLELVPHVETFQEAFAGQSVARVLVGLDSREVRQEVQREMPVEVFDASTTGAQEVIFHYNHLIEQRACLECVYPTRNDKLAQSRHIAEGLGLTLDEVQAPFITTEVAKRLAKNFPHLVAGELVGRAISSIYRENCAAAVLRAPDGEQFLAPFAFVSILAGTLLAMHLISHLQGFVAPYNFWPVSAWAPPFPPARELRGQRTGCFCTSSAYRRVAEKHRTMTPLP
jgi:molybdopterin/thiamine biosynthesis adenylyltransferase